MQAADAASTSADHAAIARLLACYREQKARIAALETELTTIKTQLDHTLGDQEVCAIADLGEVRRVAPSQSTSWDTRRLNVVIASLRVLGDDKLADQIEEARRLHLRTGYLAITLTGIERTVQV